jgi:lipopolysaccharide/colanic/teichoic acid biosynthesis glycosyltransferase
MGVLRRPIAVATTRSTEAAAPAQGSIAPAARRDDSTSGGAARLVVSERRTGPDGWRLTTKEVLDRCVAGLALVLLSPLLIAIGIAVLLSTGRPVIFRQLRVGRHYRRFEMLKFRSLRGNEPLESIDPDSDLAPGGTGELARTTRFGSFIRRWSLDELPQLVNVVRGDMSLIGPRPERPEYAEAFSTRVYRYDDRHRVKPGMSGLAQVRGFRGRTSLRDRIACDNWYIDNWSLWLDVKIAVMTFDCVRRSACVSVSGAASGATLPTSPHGSELGTRALRP